MYGHTSVNLPTKAYSLALYGHWMPFRGLPGATKDRDGWQERVDGILDISTPWLRWLHERFIYYQRIGRNCSILLCDILVVVHLVWFGFSCNNIWIWLHFWFLLTLLNLMVSYGLWRLQRNYWREGRRPRYLLHFDFISGFNNYPVGEKIIPESKWNGCVSQRRRWNVCRFL